MFSFSSLPNSPLNRHRAGRTPWTLPYWATRAFSWGVKERYKPRFFFIVAVAAFTPFNIYFSEDAWSNRTGQRAIGVKHAFKSYRSPIVPCPHSRYVQRFHMYRYIQEAGTQSGGLSVDWSSVFERSNLHRFMHYPGISSKASLLSKEKPG